MVLKLPVVLLPTASSPLAVLWFPVVVSGERGKTIGRVVESGRVCEKCFPTSGRVLESGCVDEQRSKTNRGIAATGGVLKQGTKTVGRVTSSGRIPTECGKAGCGVIIAPGVLKSARKPTVVFETTVRLYTLWSARLLARE